MSRRSSRRGKSGSRQMDIWLFSQQQKRNAKTIEKLPNPKKIDNKTRNNFCGRLALLAIAKGKTDEICRKTHMLARLKGFQKLQYVTQRINQSGEPDGKEAAEERENLVLLPKVGEIIPLKNGKSLLVAGYNLAANKVEVSDATTTKRKGSALVADVVKKSKTKKKSSKKKKVVAKAKPKSKAKTPRREKKSMDKPTTSSNESVKESDVFTVETVLKSFANPRDDLFNRSYSFYIYIILHSMIDDMCKRMYDR